MVNKYNILIIISMMLLPCFNIQGSSSIQDPSRFKKGISNISFGYGLGYNYLYSGKGEARIPGYLPPYLNGSTDEDLDAILPLEEIRTTPLSLNFILFDLGYEYFFLDHFSFRTSILPHVYLLGTDHPYAEYAYLAIYGAFNFEFRYYYNSGIFFGIGGNVDLPLSPLLAGFVPVNQWNLVTGALYGEIGYSSILNDTLSLDLSLQIQFVVGPFSRPGQEQEEIIARSGPVPYFIASPINLEMSLKWKL